MVLTQRRMRWLLPVLVAFGVACMHTLGHSTDMAHQDGTRGAAPAMHVSVEVGDPGMSVPDAISVVAADTGPVTPDSGVPVNPMAVCVAILAAALILLFAAVTPIIGHRLTFQRNRLGAVLAIAGRGPPPGRLGLRLAHLSVQRT